MNRLARPRIDRKQERHGTPEPGTSSVIARITDRLRRGAQVFSQRWRGRPVAIGAMILVVAIVAALAVLDALLVLSSTGSTEVTHAAWGAGTIMIAAFAAVAATLRVRYPVAMMVALSAAGIGLTAGVKLAAASSLPSLAALVALALIAARVARYQPATIAGPLIPLGALAVAAEPLRMAAPTGRGLLVVVICVFCFALAVAGGAYLRWLDWRRVVAAAAARQDERLELARELHDLVGHYVTGMVVQAQAARHVAEQHPAAAIAALEQVEWAGGQAMASMRRMVGALRDDAPTQPGASWEDLRELVDELAAGGIPVRLRLTPDAVADATDLAPSVYRIVGEALTNIRRHAREVTQVDITVEEGADAASSPAGRHSLFVSVTNDGLPAFPPGRDTYGLVGMRERVEALGGTLAVGPVPAGGWCVSATLPLSAS